MRLRAHSCYKKGKNQKRDASGKLQLLIIKFQKNILNYVQEKQQVSNFIFD